MSGYGGADPGVGAPQRFTFIATAGQTTFSGVDANGLTLNYKAPFVEVIIDGNWLTPDEYTATDGSSVVTPACTVGMKVYVFAFNAYSPADSLALSLNGADIVNKGAFATTLGLARPNVLINPDFRFNQRFYTSGSALPSGSYAHDRWKAGASGGDYTFTQLASSTQITIASGKTLIQIVEDINVEGGSYTLSWTGTAQARVGVNTATPSGAYASSPIVVSGQSAATTMAVEFNAGTLGKVKLEVGTTPTLFVMPDYEIEYRRCLRYAYSIGSRGVISYEPFSNGFCNATSNFYAIITFLERMRAAPTLIATAASTFVVSSSVLVAPTSISISAANQYCAQLACAASGLTAGAGGGLQANASAAAFLLFVAEL